MLIAFGNEPSNEAGYPYRVTMGPVGKGESHSDCYSVGDKKHGQQFGATFLGLREAGGKVCVLARFPVDNFTTLAFPFNDLKESDPRWVHWQPLAQELVNQKAGHAPVIRNFAASVAKLDSLLSHRRMLEQRIKTLAGQEKAWAGVALPEEVLDRILRLVDSFKAGRPVKGILLYGPPGTGKTLIARKLAQNAGCNFVAVGISDLKGQHIGHTGPRVRELWEKCRAGAPTILFLDECESAFAARGSSASDAFDEELVQTFLSEWDGFNQSAGQVFVIGATNRHDLLDNAIMSRFTESIEIGLPDAGGRMKILS